LIALEIKREKKTKELDLKGQRERKAGGLKKERKE